MKELNPSENPWTTLNKHFGEDAEKKIQKLAERKTNFCRKNKKSKNRSTDLLRQPRTGRRNKKNRNEKKEEECRKKISTTSIKE